MTLVKVTETDALCTTHRFLIPPQISGQLCLKTLESSVCCHQPAVFQPQSIFRALESLSRCLDSTWKCKGLNTLLIKWQTGVPGHPSFQWTTPRCIPHGSSQSSAKSFWLPTAVLRSVMFLFFWLLWSPLPWTLLLPGISPQTVCTQVSALSSLLNEVKSLEDAKEVTHSSEKR